MIGKRIGKRLVSMLVIIGGVLLLLVGSSSVALSKKVITFWYIEPEPFATMIEDSIKRFEEANPDVDIKGVQYPHQQYKTKIRVVLAAGNPPDIWFLWGDEGVRPYIEAGMVHDITDLVHEMDAMETGVPIYDYFLPTAWDLVTQKGRIWGMPGCMITFCVFTYNKSLFNRYGVTIPETYSELKSLIVKLQQAGLEHPVALANKAKWAGLYWLAMISLRLGGIDLWEKVRSRDASFTNPVFVKTFEENQELVRMGAFSEGFQGLDWDAGQDRALMYTEKAALALYDNDLPDYMVTEAGTEFFEKVDVFPFPRIVGGKGDPNTGYGTPGAHFFHVSKTCPYLKEAVEFIPYLSDRIAIEERLRYGRVLPVKGIEDLLVKYPRAANIYDLFFGFGRVLANLDVIFFLPEMGDEIMDVSQDVLGLEITPEEAVKRLDEAITAAYGPLRK